MKYLIKILKIYTPIILIFIGLATISLTTDQNMYQEPSVHDKALYDFIAKMGSKFEKKYKISLIGRGGGATPEGIWLMCVSFEREDEPLTEEEARKLIIHCVDDFLSAVNSDEKLKPFLKEYPFTPKNLELTIFNYNKSRILHCFPSIAVVKDLRGKIGFFTEDPSTKPRYHTKKYETYEESVAILKNEH